MMGVAKRRLLDLLTEDPTSDWSGSADAELESEVELLELELMSPGALLFFFFFFFFFFLLLLLLSSSSSFA